MKKRIKKKAIYLTGLAIIACSPAFTVHAKPTMKVRYKNYKVRGSSIKDIKRSISINGIKGRNGLTYGAMTDYDLSWDIDYEQTQNGCVIAHAETHIEIAFHMPLLEDSSTLSIDEKRQWGQYYSALMHHEEGHANFGVQAAYKIEEALSRLSPSTNCVIMANTANAVAADIEHKYHLANFAYDRATKHGHKQGAILISRRK